jgi:hypothetical protein
MLDNGCNFMQRDSWSISGLRDYISVISGEGIDFAVNGHLDYIALLLKDSINAMSGSQNALVTMQFQYPRNQVNASSAVFRLNPLEYP